ncbi:MAG: GAF and ANTAR domain-containing protein [Nocardioidaceae bacterium]|nr:GAF and ANTAR domain-containing protein [Nocardioidaceae bacterium]
MADEASSSARTRARVRTLVEAERFDSPGGELLASLCDAMVLELLGVAAAVSVVGASGPVPVSRSRNGTAATLVDLQATRGEGPAVEASRRGRPVLVTAMPEEVGRWPGYAPDAIRLGVCAAFAFPMGMGSARVGVLELVREDPGALDQPQMGTALGFAEVATEIALDDLEHLEWAEETRHRWPEALRPVVHQAQGMVMVALGVSIDEALVRMRAQAFVRGVDLDELARLIVDGRERLDDR